jgi:hypothetical protein
MNKSEIGGGGCGLVLFGILIAVVGVLAIASVFGPVVGDLMTLVP